MRSYRERTRTTGRRKRAPGWTCRLRRPTAARRRWNSANRGRTIACGMRAAAGVPPLCPWLISGPVPLCRKTAGRVCRWAKSPPGRRSADRLRQPLLATRIRTPCGWWMHHPNSDRSLPNTWRAPAWKSRRPSAPPSLTLGLRPDRKGESWSESRNVCRLNAALDWSASVTRCRFREGLVDVALKTCRIHWPCDALQSTFIRLGSIAPHGTTSVHIRRPRTN